MQEVFFFLLMLPLLQFLGVIEFCKSPQESERMFFDRHLKSSVCHISLLLGVWATVYHVVPASSLSLTGMYTMGGPSCLVPAHITAEFTVFNPFSISEPIWETVDFLLLN